MTEKKPRPGEGGTRSVAAQAPPAWRPPREPVKPPVKKPSVPVPWEVVKSDATAEEDLIASYFDPENVNNELKSVAEPYAKFLVVLRGLPPGPKRVEAIRKLKAARDAAFDAV